MPVDDRRDVAAAEVARVDVDRGTALDRRAILGVVERGFADGGAGQCGDLSRDAEHGEPVGAVRRHRHLEDRVADDVGKRPAERRVGRQHEDALVVFRQAKLALAEHHAGRFDAANHGRLEDGLLAAVPVAHARADGGEGDLLADGEVRRAADDAVPLIGADVDRREAQAVGVGVRLDGGDAADADVGAPVAAGALDRVDGEAGHRQPVRQILGGKAQVDVVAQPLE